MNPDLIEMPALGLRGILSGTGGNMAFRHDGLDYRLEIYDVRIKILSTDAVFRGESTITHSHPVIDIDPDLLGIKRYGVKEWSAEGASGLLLNQEPFNFEENGVKVYGIPKTRWLIWHPALEIEIVMKDAALYRNKSSKYLNRWDGFMQLSSDGLKPARR